MRDSFAKSTWALFGALAVGSMSGILTASFCRRFFGLRIFLTSFTLKVSKTASNGVFYPYGNQAQVQKESAPNTDETI